MRKELSYYTIEQSYGGNQSWFRDPMMKLGGCGAATACDSCICLGLFRKMEFLYPYDLQKISKEDYVQFAMKMKPFLRPRMQGINTLKLFIDGFSQYLTEHGAENILLEEFTGNQSFENAKEVIRQQIDRDLPIPYLLLRHKSSSMKFFVWHWFLVVGYEEYEDEFYIKVATYGNYQWLSLKELWNTGYREKGGMVLLKDNS
jgi:hypothetical protein